MQIGLELLAPAKNKDIGIAAIDCGADAVYIAGPKFGAREAAGNSFSDIAELTGYAHRFGVRVYLALNTILYEHELEEARQMIREAYRIGCDAVIVQDLALLRMDLPPIPLYASTQTVIRTPEQAVFAQSLGFGRLILERGLSLEQIREIRRSVQVPVEAFVHGALCVCYSGQCYLSQRLTGRSANRGACAQACRSNYTLADRSGRVLTGNLPLLSLKDLNLGNRLPDLIRAGVTSFKIEGRLKNASYVKNTVAHYRRLLDDWIRKHPRYVRTSWGESRGGFAPRPELTFHRGFTEYFLDGERGPWRSADGAKYLGEFLGLVTQSSCDRHGRLEFRYESPEEIRNGDGLCFVTPDGSILGARASHCRGALVGTASTLRIPPGSRIYRNLNSAFEKSLETDMPVRLIPATLSFLQEPGGGYVLRAELPAPVSDTGTPGQGPQSGSGRPEETACGAENAPGQTVVRYDIPAGAEPARDPETARQTLIRQLGKTAGHFRFEVREVRCDAVPFFPVAVLNGFRREIARLAAEALESLRRTARRSEEQHTARLRQQAAQAPPAVPPGTAPRTLPGASPETNSEAQYGTQPGTKSATRPETLPAAAPHLTYAANCANSLAREVYRARGAVRIDPAYEIRPPENAELMRTKYCLRYELGLCSRYGKADKKGSSPRKAPQTVPSAAEPLFLLNGANRLQVNFDCARCEMVIIG